MNEPFRTFWRLSALCACWLAAGGGPGAAEQTGAVAPIARSDYLDTIEAFHDRYAKPRLSWLERKTPQPHVAANLETADFFAFEYRTKGEGRAAERAVAFIEQAYRVSEASGELGTPNARPRWNAPIRIHRIWRRLEGSSAFTAVTREQLRQLMRSARPDCREVMNEYGPFNRPLGCALAAEILLHYVPDLADSRRRRAYVERVWSEFRAFDDTTENSAGYNSASLLYLIDWIQLRDAHDEVFSDPAFHHLLERYMLQVLPLGSLPHYGDSVGWNVEWGRWIHIFELGARITGDGRFRWAAHRLYRYGTSRIEDLSSWSYTGSRAIESLMEAYLVADDSIAPSPPQQDLVVLERRDIGIRSPRPGGGGKGYFLKEARIPSKAVLRSSAAPESFAMTLELTPAAVHNPPVPASVIALADQGAVLLMDSGYMEREISDHNALWIEDYEGFPLSSDQPHVEVLASKSVGPLLYVSVRVEGYGGYPVSLERRVVFARQGAALIVDRVRFRRSFRARLGPVFNLRVLGLESGESWVNGSLGAWIPVRGIGKGKPVLARWKNPPRDLLIRFLPIAGGELHVVDRHEHDPTNPLPYRVQYRTRATPKAGDVLTFASVLLPHAPNRHPSKLAAEIRVISSDEGSVAARVPLDGGESVWLSAGPIQASELHTDAAASVVVMDGERPVRLGITEGRRLDVRGARVVEEAARGDVAR